MVDRTRVRERAVHDKQIEHDHEDDADGGDEEEQEYQAEHPVQWLKRLDD